jgi:hypothetical protein
MKKCPKKYFKKNLVLQVGWLGWRSAEDEELVRAIADACAYDSGRQRNTSGRPPYGPNIFEIAHCCAFLPGGGPKAL